MLIEEKLNHPNWMTDEALRTVEKGYLLPGTTVKDTFKRVSKGVKKYLPEIENIDEEVFYCLWKGWIGLASPVFSNFNSNRGLPISCYSVELSDSVSSIFSHVKETAALSQNGGGVGVYFGNLRPQGSPISGGGKSNGVSSFSQIYDVTSRVVSQGGVRRGSFAFYLPIDHPDVRKVLNSKKHEMGDPRTHIDSNIGITITDDWINSMLQGDKEKYNLFCEILKTRLSSGSPYLVFIDNVNNNNPKCYKERNLKVKLSNLCFTGDTLVAVADGSKPKPIKELAESGKLFPVYSARKSTKNKWFTEIKNAIAFKTGTQPVYEIELDDGSSFKCTAEHLLADKDCNWIEAQNSIGANLQQFVSFKNRSKLTNINCLTGTHKQSNLIWEFNNGSVPEGYEIDHIKPVSQGGSDSLDNLQLLTKEQHKAKTKIERLGSKNPIHKVNKDYLKSYVSNATKASGNPRFSGIDNFELISLGKELYSEFGQFNRKIYNKLLERGYNVPKSFSNYRFGKSFKLYSEYVLGIKEYNGEFEYSKVNSKSLREENNYEKNYKKAKNLLENGLKVVSIREVGIEDVYDLSVEENQNFYIVTNEEEDFSSGVLVHNCSEIVLYTDENHSFVCVLSSLNLAKWDEWKDFRFKSGRSVPQVCTNLLEAVVTEFLNKTAGKWGMGRSRRFAQKSRALGIGTMGLTMLYQIKGLPFKSKESRKLNIEIHKFIYEEALKESKNLAKIYGEPEWCKGHGIRHTHLMAIAPTRTNSVITGAFSPGVEPIDRNYYVIKQQQGTFIRKNPILEKVLESLGKNNSETWESISLMDGSVKHLNFLSEKQKEIFLTAREIDQKEIIRQACDRQAYVDQAQSINLFVDPDIPAKDLIELHLLGWKNGLKSLYYLKSSSPLKIKNKKEILIVTKPGCEYCSKAIELINIQKNVNLTVKDYKNKEIHDIIVNIDWNTYPKIFINNKFIGGYNEVLQFFGHKTEKYEDCLSCEG